MDRKLKNFNIGNKDSFEKKKMNHCSVCGGKFRSHSHFDVLCNLCWAENEMKPYLAFGRHRRVGMAN